MKPNQNVQRQLSLVLIRLLAGSDTLEVLGLAQVPLVDTYTSTSVRFCSSAELLFNTSFICYNMYNKCQCAVA